MNSPMDFSVPTPPKSPRVPLLKGRSSLVQMVSRRKLPCNVPFVSIDGINVQDHFGDKTEWGAGNIITQHEIHSFLTLGSITSPS
ncbi:uncharacterized protein E5676_scaffold876G00120 [Cucumis melo var. makuwa]|uniref:Uncharacterized protein n=1 Tax=Cucumis melo var. makuwa TaxID=1194695 RepID=A0A5D3DUF1_CUCMM|nr:uncharacterized protein E5676_scaffold876G00120 [Cucumis melo var. makuwa]